MCLLRRSVDRPEERSSQIDSHDDLRTEEGDRSKYAPASHRKGAPQVATPKDKRSKAALFGTRNCRSTNVPRNCSGRSSTEKEAKTNGYGWDTPAYQSNEGSNIGQGQGTTWDSGSGAL
jgi:hypothetical protein